MEEKRLTGEEQRAIMREQYKQEYKQRKEYLEMLQKAQRINKINRELGKLEAMVTGDDSEDWMRQLNNQTALNEARVELALENATNNPEDTTPRDRLAHLTALERMKLEMGLVTEEQLGIAPVAEVPVAPTEKTLGGEDMPAEEALLASETKQLGGIELPPLAAETEAEMLPTAETPPVAEATPVETPAETQPVPPVEKTLSGLETPAPEPLDNVPTSPTEPGA